MQKVDFRAPPTEKTSKDFLLQRALRGGGIDFKGIHDGNSAVSTTAAVNAFYSKMNEKPAIPELKGTRAEVSEIVFRNEKGSAPGKITLAKEPKHPKKTEFLRNLESRYRMEDLANALNDKESIPRLANAIKDMREGGLCDENCSIMVKSVRSLYLALHVKMADQKALRKVMPDAIEIMRELYENRSLLAEIQYRQKANMSAAPGEDGRKKAEEILTLAKLSISWLNTLNEENCAQPKKR